MTNTGEIRIEKDFRPFPVFWSAAKVLREIRNDERVAGRYWAGLGGFVLLAFAIEGFCQTEGPTTFPNDWETGRKIERKPVLDKLKLIAQELGVAVDYQQSPWCDVERVMKVRNSLAHPKPIRRAGRTDVDMSSDVHPIDAAAHLVAEAWEPLLEPAAAEQLATSVQQALEKVWAASGRSKWAMYRHGTTAASMSIVR